jgi:ABC-type transport system involved in multi-copper enzyme maturation permease subunit
MLAVARIELRKSFLSRRAIGLLILAVLPLAQVLLVRFSPAYDPTQLADATQGISLLFQSFFLRFFLFLGCAIVFGNLIRREVLDRSLHYYFLTPLRRDLLVVAKYLTALAAMIVLFGTAMLATFLTAYVQYQGWRQFLFQGPGLGHLASYLLVTALACVGYGAVFLLFGSYFKSPAIPTLAVMGWEGIHFLLPPLLKKLSVIHYLQGLCPVPISQGPLAILADAPSPWVAIPGLLALAAVAVMVSARKVRKMEISYEEE